MFMRIKTLSFSTSQHASESDNESEASDTFREETDDVFRLPPPEPLPYDEFGVQMSFRVPPPLERSDEAFDINYVSTVVSNCLICTNWTFF